MFQASGALVTGLFDPADQSESPSPFRERAERRL
jgi:hypothetical protein